MRLNLSAFKFPNGWLLKTKQIYVERNCRFDNYMHELQLKLKQLQNNFRPDMLGRHAKLILSQFVQWSGHLTHSSSDQFKLIIEVCSILLVYWRLLPGRISAISSKWYTNSRRRMKVTLSMLLSICVENFDKVRTQFSTCHPLTRLASHVQYYGGGEIGLNGRKFVLELQERKIPTIVCNTP